MAQRQHSKTMKVEMMKSIKNCAFLNAHCEIHKQFSVFCFFQSCKSDLPLPESGHHRNKGKCCKFTVKTKRCGSWGGDHRYIYIYIYTHIYLLIQCDLGLGALGVEPATYGKVEAGPHADRTLSKMEHIGR